MNWIKQELVATVELDSLLDPLDADYGRRSMIGLAARRPQQACTNPRQDPSNDTRDQREHSAAAVPEYVAAQNRFIPLRIVARHRPPTPPLRACGDHRPVREITAARPTRFGLSPISAALPRPRPCRCVWLPATALIVRAALPRHRTGASDTATPRLILAIRYMLSRCEPKTTCVISRSAATLTRTGLSALCAIAHPSARSPLAIRQRVAVRPYAQPIPRA